MSNISENAMEIPVVACEQTEKTEAMPCREDIQKEFKRIKSDIEKVAAVQRLLAVCIRFSVTILLGLTIYMALICINLIYPISTSNSRLMFYGLGIVFLLMTVFYTIRPFFDKVKDEELALLIEKKYPSLMDRFICSVEMSKEGAEGKYSPELVKALWKDTNKVKNALKLDLRKALTLVGGKRYIVAAVVVAFLACVSSFVAPEFILKGTSGMEGVNSFVRYAIKNANLDKDIKKQEKMLAEQEKKSDKKIDEAKQLLAEQKDLNKDLKKKLEERKQKAAEKKEELAKKDPELAKKPWLAGKQDAKIDFEKGAVTGTVMLDGKPAVGFYVAAKLGKEGIGYGAKTDKNGKFVIEDLKKGTGYFVWVVNGEYTSAPAGYRNGVVLKDKTKDGFNFSVAKKPPADPKKKDEKPHVGKAFHDFPKMNFEAKKDEKENELNKAKSLDVLVLPDMPDVKQKPKKNPDDNDIVPPKMNKKLEEMAKELEKKEEKEEKKEKKDQAKKEEEKKDDKEKKEEEKKEEQAKKEEDKKNEDDKKMDEEKKEIAEQMKEMAEKMEEMKNKPQQEKKDPKEQEAELKETQKKMEEIAKKLEELNKEEKDEQKKEINKEMAKELKEMKEELKENAEMKKKQEELQKKTEEAMKEKKDEEKEKNAELKDEKNEEAKEKMKETAKKMEEAAKEMEKTEMEKALEKALEAEKKLEETLQKLMDEKQAKLDKNAKDEEEKNKEEEKKEEAKNDEKKKDEMKEDANKDEKKKDEELEAQKKAIEEMQKKLEEEAKKANQDKLDQKELEETVKALEEKVKELEKTDKEAAEKLKKELEDLKQEAKKKEDEEFKEPSDKEDKDNKDKRENRSKEIAKKLQAISNLLSELKNRAFIGKEMGNEEMELADMRKDEVPAKYKKMVERYYQAISK